MTPEQQAQLLADHNQVCEWAEAGLGFLAAKSRAPADRVEFVRRLEAVRQMIERARGFS